MVVVRAVVAVVVVLSLAVALGACGGQSHHMWPVKNPGPIAASEDNAALVIVYPGPQGAVGSATIVDGRGGFVGTALPGTHFAVLLPPGEQLLVALADDVRPLKLNLAPGRVYFVHAEAEMGVVGTVVSLWAVAPGSPRWASLGQWLAETSPRAPDIRRGQGDLQKRATLPNEINRAQQMLGTYDAATLAQRTVLPEYGLAAAVQAGAPIPEPAPLPGTEPPPVVEAPPEPTGTQLGPLYFEKTKIVSTGEESEVSVEVIEEGTVSTEQGRAVKFHAEEANFGDQLVGYTYEAEAIEQLAEGDEIALFVPGLKYRKIVMHETAAGEEYEDQDGNPVFAPEKLGDGRLNGAWIQVKLETVQRNDTSVRIRLAGRVRSTRGSIHKNLELLRGEAGYTLKPLIKVKAEAYEVEEIPFDKAKRKVGIFALTGEAFAATTDRACSTDVSITAVADGELTTEGQVDTLDGKSHVFCPGAKHKWVGTLEYGGYKLRSREEDPLRFRVDAHKGYVFAGGKGSVTLPDGKSVTLP